MSIFEELERIKHKGFIGVIALNVEHPEEDNKITTLVAFGENDEKAELFVFQKDDETIEQMVYRSILEFDEKYPEHA